MNYILEKIKEYDTIIIHGHKRPDGDCFGSQFGLKNIIQTNFPEKKVYVVGETSNFVSFLGQVDIIEDSVFQGALSIIVDTATKDRVSDDRFTLSKETIKIDHHIRVDDYADFNYVDEESPACSQIIAEFWSKYMLNITSEGSRALYTGIVTDTGRFKYRGVTRKTMNLAGMLLDQNVDIEELDALLSVETINTIKLKAEILNTFNTTPDGFAYVVVRRELIEKFKVTDEEAASMVNLLSNIEGYPVWALIIEYKTDIRVRLRSRGPNVDLLANAYHGGGHAKASGASLDSFDDLERFCNDCNELVKQYKKGLLNK